MKTNHMKRFTLAIVFASLLLAGCKDESIDFGGGGNGETEIGYLSLSALEVDVANYAEEITSAGRSRPVRRVRRPMRRVTTR